MVDPLRELLSRRSCPDGHGVRAGCVGLPQHWCILYSLWRAVFRSLLIDLLGSRCRSIWGWGRTRIFEPTL